ncbi:MAG: TatD family nuclease-associated radical SAM protein [Thermodesulfovibrionales bacterium]
MKKAPGLIDTHCHLEMSAFDPDRDEVVRRALEAGVEAMITIGSDARSNALALELCRRHEAVYCAVGVHPHDAKDFTEETYLALRKWASAEKAVAIGETGLDYHYDHSPREVQREVFARHLALAAETGLPAVIHSREARADTLDILRDSGITKGVMHCFSGDMEMAERAMSMGLYISFAGPLTFKNARRLREVAAAVPDDYLLVETDAPYLAPEPLRGKRNEPANIVHTARELASARGVSPEDIARITTLNARRLFGVGEVPVRGEIAYRIRDSLYLNITNRCTNRCTFCVKFHSDFVKGHNLRLAGEPSAEELKAAIGDPSAYREVVFCGYGEPLLRLDLVKELSAWIKQRGGRVRVDTNGQGNLIHGRDILPELEGLVDSVSVSLDAQDRETYERLCEPEFPGAFEAVVEFIRRARRHIPAVQATVVGAEGVDVEKCAALAAGLGVPLRVRKLDVVG